jgi:outer membrane protein assembly factor BamB
MYLQKILILCFFANALFSQSPNVESEWKGPDRNSIYQENGLLKEWPEEGPGLLWRFEGLNMGHSSPAVTDDAIFITGMPDSVTGILYCLDHQGQLIWEDKYGDEYKSNYMGSRSTPVIAGNQLYIVSGAGEVICYDIDQRKKSWTVSFIPDYHDSIPQFGYAESVLIDGDRLYCTPGVKEHAVICLDRVSGELNWSSATNGDKPTYTSAMMVNHEGNKILVIVLENSMLGMDPTNGDLYWEIPYQPAYGSHANTPVYYEGMIYMGSSVKGDNGGFIALQLLEGGKQAAVQWTSKEIANFLSGFIVRDGKIYTNKGRKKGWFCLDAMTGETLYSWEDYKEGIPLFADESFYVFCEDGSVHLSREQGNSMEIISSFKLDISTINPFAPLWATPVIKNKKLYIRHKGSLFAYDIGKAK